VIAALIRSPNAAVPQVRERACRLLADLHAANECALLDPQHLAYIEEGYHIRPYMKLAPHVANRFRKNARAGARMGLVQLDSSTQTKCSGWALHALQKQITSLRSQNMSRCAVIVIENATGKCDRLCRQHRAINRRPRMWMPSWPERQAGSTLKPFIYGKAIDERILTPATVLEDSPLAISVANRSVSSGEISTKPIATW